MSEDLNKQELNRLAQIGSADASGDVSPNSIGTTIAVSVLYCTSPIISAISTISIGASALFSCVNNPAQCG
jgi:hypothetical protein